MPFILITGASTGIGAACAVDLVGQGFTVLAGVRSADAGASLASKAPGKIVPIELDVTRPEDIAAAVNEVDHRVSTEGLWGLVNNAGIAVTGPMEIVPMEALRRQFEVNFFGAVAVTQAFLPLLRKARGRIVNMSSVSGLVSAPYFGPYTASKFALEAASDCLRSELARWGIAVSVVEPGAVDTPIWNKAIEAARGLFQGLPQKGRELYEDDLHTVEAVAQRLAGSAMPVERVVRVVRHALTSRRPRTRYPVGLQTQIAWRGAHLIPDRLRDWIIRRQMGL